MWTETAAKQRREILKYWIKNNGNDVFAKKLIILTRNRLIHIAKSPQLFKRADFPNTHVAAMGNFSLYYKFSKEKIIVTAFWDNRQNPERLFDLIKK